jgi:tRNA threonylcarbamoyladenosine biosynthesis protein TsaB
MRVLGLDAATAACSAALVEDGRVLAREVMPMEHGHGQALVPMVLRVMGGRPFCDLDAISVTRGPGRFTGIRVALATARGLGLAAARPVFGVTTFAAVARTAGLPPGATKLLVLIESKRRDLYAQLFSSAREPLAEAAALLPEDLAAYAGAGPLALAGDGAERAAPALAAAQFAAGPRTPDPAAVAALAAEALARSGPPAVPPAALYLRAPDVTLPKRRQGEHP